MLLGLFGRIKLQQREIISETLNRKLLDYILLTSAMSAIFRTSGMRYNTEKLLIMLPNSLNVSNKMSPMKYVLFSWVGL